MLYLKCPTCRTILANKQLLHAKRLAEICNSNKSKEDKNKEKQKLLDELELIRSCCRMRMMSYVKLIDIIK
jgi:DNA-directed RNA polymerase subunit N (RpoN/RPB10)